MVQRKQRNQYYAHTLTLCVQSFKVDFQVNFPFNKNPRQVKWHQAVQREAFCDALNALTSFSTGAPPRIPLGSLRRSPDPPVGWGGGFSNWWVSPYFSSKIWRPFCHRLWKWWPFLAVVSSPLSSSHVVYPGACLGFIFWGGHSPGPISSFPFFLSFPVSPPFPSFPYSFLSYPLSPLLVLGSNLSNIENYTPNFAFLPHEN